MPKPKKTGLAPPDYPDLDTCRECGIEFRWGSHDIEPVLSYEVTLSSGSEAVFLCRDCLRKKCGRTPAEHPDWKIQGGWDDRDDMRGAHVSGFVARLDSKSLRLRSSSTKLHPELKPKPLVDQFRAIATEWKDQWRLEGRARRTACLTECMEKDDDGRSSS